jgi:glycosyltransferase involved in cell wall biosynthesis
MVLHIITSLNIGGAEIMLQKLIIERKINGYNDSVICLGCRGDIGDKLQKNNVNVHYLHISSSYTLITGFSKLNKLIKFYNPSIIQTWLYHADLIGGLIGFLNKIPVIWNIRQTKFNSYKSIFTILIMRLCAGLSYFIPKVIICAAYSSKISHSKYGYNKSIFKVIPNGFLVDESPSVEKIKDLKNELLISDKDIVIGNVGRFHVDKGYEYFIKAASILSDKYQNLKFIMIGNGLDLNNQELINWIRFYQLENKFILIGKSEIVSEYLKIFDIFCLSSISEGFPNVVGEAMLQSKPCVVTNSGDSRFIVGDTGLVAKVKDAIDLSDKLIEMIELDSLERIKLGVKAQKRIKQNFMIDFIVKKYTDTYNEFSK